MFLNNKGLALLAFLFSLLPVNGQKESSGATWSEIQATQSRTTTPSSLWSSTTTTTDAGLGGGWIFLIVVACLWVCFFCFLAVLTKEHSGDSYDPCYSGNMYVACGPCIGVLGLACGAALFALFLALLPFTAPVAAWFAKPRHVTRIIIGSIFVKWVSFPFYFIYMCWHHDTHAIPLFLPYWPTSLLSCTVSFGCGLFLECSTFQKLSARRSTLIPPAQLLTSSPR